MSKTNPTKQCRRCYKFKPREENFGKSKRSKDGLTDKCKDCVAINNHEQHERRKLLPKVYVTERPCYDCERILPRDQFSVNNANLDGLCHFCKECNAIRHKSWSARPESAILLRDLQTKWRWGITVDEFYKKLESQGGGCAICGKKPTSKGEMCQDHNHDTGVLRGILCRKCNTGLGYVEKEDFRKKAIEYLGYHNPSTEVLDEEHRRRVAVRRTPSYRKKFQGDPGVSIKAIVNARLDAIHSQP